MSPVLEGENGGHSAPTIQEYEDMEEEDEKPTPLPMMQLLSVFMIQFAEPVTALCVYPFVNQFVRETGITKGDEKKTGYYAGIIESAFFLSESLTVVQWGYLSDRYGRRPILLIAPLGLGFAMLIFGMSTTYWPLVVARCFQGAFNGNVGVSKSVIAELTDSTNRADAFAFIPLMWSVGQTTGPLIGGLLSNPAKRWPDTLGRISYLRSHPYFLPCAVAGIISFITFSFAYLVLKETLPSLVAEEKRKAFRENPSDDLLKIIVNEETPLLVGSSQAVSRVPTLSSSNSSSEVSSISSVQPNKPRIQDVFIRPVLMTILCLGLLAFMDMCNFALLPLMWSTPIPLGGLGLDPFRIGVALGLFGLINALIQVRIMGPLIRRYGTRRVYRVSSAALFLSFSMYPIMKYFAQRAGRVDAIVVTCIVAQLCCQMSMYFAYGTIQILVVESVPEGGPIGTANGLAQMVSSGARTIAPTFASSLFSVSLQKNLANGNMVYFILMGLTLINIRCTALLPPEKAKEKRKATIPTG
ncbi:major facilitator superfamily multidrug-resistance, DHA1 sub-family [Pholiota conissans]|uniref:Major facilitator superfamily multidrug-resistance, DHA1 sub-family n=1 Tax=Pholiota conissans TaxID=109636 RepID=A0A9P5Z3J4_9AGAR|nr:major facilitator superfamily multidrug-resistance, DHA1 sub-family [Pholiota conissans]